MFDHPEFAHESVYFHEDPETGLRTIIAMHDRTLGPAIGGCRLYPYADVPAATTDVLRLSRGMTYKCAIAGIPFGGGKAVIIGDQGSKTPDLLRAFGRFVDSLGGRYITSFDVGTTLDDLRVIGEVTSHVGGISEGAGDAAETTAAGVFRCMIAAADHRWPGRPLGDLMVAIQGVGSVGGRLAKLLADAGATIIAADVDSGRGDSVAAAVGGRTVAASEILAAKADILAPCALGSVLTVETVDALRAGVVCGGANNQLADEAAAHRLVARGITYVPDYLANAGGIIDLHYQLNRLDRGMLPGHLDRLAMTLRDVLTRASSSAVSPAAAADLIVEERLSTARGQARTHPNDGARG